MRQGGALIHLQLLKSDYLFICLVRGEASEVSSLHKPQQSEPHQLRARAQGRDCRVLLAQVPVPLLSEMSVQRPSR